MFSNILLGNWQLVERNGSIIKNNKVSSANSLVPEVNPSGRSLMYNKNNNGPRMEP